MFLGEELMNILLVKYDVNKMLSKWSSYYKVWYQSDMHDCWSQIQVVDLYVYYLVNFNLNISMHI